MAITAITLKYRPAGLSPQGVAKSLAPRVIRALPHLSDRRPAIVTALAEKITLAGQFIDVNVDELGTALGLDAEQTVLLTPALKRPHLMGKKLAAIREELSKLDLSALTKGPQSEFASFELSPAAPDVRDREEVVEELISWARDNMPISYFKAFSPREIAEHLRHSIGRIDSFRLEQSGQVTIINKNIDPDLPMVLENFKLKGLSVKRAKLHRSRLGDLAIYVFDTGKQKKLRLDTPGKRVKLAVFSRQAKAAGISVSDTQRFVRTLTDDYFSESSIQRLLAHLTLFQRVRLGQDNTVVEIANNPAENSLRVTLAATNVPQVGFLLSLVDILRFHDLALDRVFVETMESSLPSRDKAVAIITLYVSAGDAAQAGLADDLRAAVWAFGDRFFHLGDLKGSEILPAGGITTLNVRQLNVLASLVYLAAEIGRFSPSFPTYFNVQLKDILAMFPDATVKVMNTFIERQNAGLPLPEIIKPAPHSYTNVGRVIDFISSVVRMIEKSNFDQPDARSLAFRLSPEKLMGSINEANPSTIKLALSACGKGFRGHLIQAGQSLENTVKIVVADDESHFLKLNLESARVILEGKFGGLLVIRKSENIQQACRDFLRGLKSVEAGLEIIEFELAAN